MNLYVSFQLPRPAHASSLHVSRSRQK